MITKLCVPMYRGYASMPVDNCDVTFSNVNSRRVVGVAGDDIMYYILVVCKFGMLESSFKFIYFLHIINAFIHNSSYVSISHSYTYFISPEIVFVY